MPWQLSDDVTVFAGRASPLLEADPITNTVALTILDWLLSGRSFSAETPLFAWYHNDAGQVSGAVLMTPPYELLLAFVPATSIAELVTSLQDHDVQVPGVRSMGESGDLFAAAWTAATDVNAVTTTQLRLYGLDVLEVPDPPPAGRARLATEGDLDLAMLWWQAFQLEAETHQFDVRSLVTHAVTDGLLWLWVDDDERPVAMAARKASVAGASRIGPVYTPPQNRNRGCASAVTAACAAAALTEGASQVLLFTDLANPVSNLIYQRIGFRPISDASTIRFVPGATGSTIGT
jgi:GNAT superfamily N-acetyltransferase